MSHRDGDIVARRACRRGRRAGAFTLIELLLVISIIALLISILVPAVSKARNEAQIAKCLSRLREIGAGTSMYMVNDEQRVIPWYYYPVHPAFQGQVTTCTPWVFGGFKATNPDALNLDSSLYPAQLRPLNAYVARDASCSLASEDRGRDVIDLYIDPGDRSFSTSIISQDITIVEEEAKSSWEANGSSYTLNTRWAQGYVYPSGNFNLNDFLYGRPPENIPFGQKLARYLIGGGASSFIMWVEQGFYSATYRAMPTLPNGAAPQRYGWHRKWSTWSMGFADGHAKHGYYDTRLVYGLGGTIWQPNYQPE